MVCNICIFHIFRSAPGSVRRSRRARLDGRSRLDTTKVTTAHAALGTGSCVALLCTPSIDSQDFHLLMVPGKRLAVGQVVQGMAVRCHVVRCSPVLTVV